MAKFRKRPVVIEAVQLTAYNPHEIERWVNDNGGKAWRDPSWSGFVVIGTLEGDHRAGSGDWIIRGVAGEFYPCKPDIFAATYEAVDEAAALGKDGKCWR